MSWYLYLIECVDGSIYTGITTDVGRRYAQHLSGKGAKYTRAHPPKQLLLHLPYPDRASASQAEYRIKQLSAVQKRALVLQEKARSACQTHSVDEGAATAHRPDHPNPFYSSCT